MANALGAFLGAKQAGLGLQRQQQGILTPDGMQIQSLGLQRQQQGLQQGRQQLSEFGRKSGISRESERIKFMNQAGKALLSLPLEQRFSAFSRLEPMSAKVGIQPGTFTQERMSDEELNRMVSTTEGFINNPQSFSAAQREFEGLTKNFTEEEKAQARRVKTGLEPRAVGSSVQTITEKGSAQEVAQTEKIISGAKESGKLGEQLKFKPKIAKAVEIAKGEAKAQGGAVTDLKVMEAALPTLKESVGELRELSQIATSTIGGKIFDQAVKQSGFGSTGGATARAKFIAIINNQVLPLLKPTFGAAFTVSEGEALKATMGDPDASPDQKLAQLDAFIQQKERDIRTKGAEVESFTGEVLFNHPQFGGITEGDIAETMRANSMTREQVIQRLGGQ